MAIRAADVVGYTRLAEAHETSILAAIKDLRKIVLEPLLTEHRGRVVKLMSDGLLGVHVPTRHILASLHWIYGKGQSIRTHGR